MNSPFLHINAAAVVPDCYAEWRPLIQDAIDLFLARLSHSRTEAITRHQAVLPPDTGEEERAVALMRDCPMLHKLGQVLARHQRLDAAFRARLQRLENSAPSMRLDDVREHVLRELGDTVTRYRIELSGEPIAEGSVAVVLPCTWAPPRAKRRRNGVLKVLKPGVSELLAEDLAILDEVTVLLDERKDRYKLPGLDYGDTLGSVRDLLTEEVKLDQEQRHIREARTVFDRIEGICVPKLLPFCTPRVTAMEAIAGVTMADYTERVGEAREQSKSYATRIVESMLAHSVFSREALTFFHADPHAGNFMAMDDGQLALLDWSLIGRLTKPEREGLVQIVLGALRLDTKHIEKALARLAVVPAAKGVLRASAREVLREVRKGQFPGLSWVTHVLETAAGRGVRFSADLILFRKSIFTLRGLVYDVDPNVSIDRIFLAGALRALIREWPRRLFSLPRSRNFATHLSNTDLLRVYLGVPLTIAKFWSQTLGDLAGEYLPELSVSRG